MSKSTKTNGNATKGAIVYTPSPSVPRINFAFVQRAELTPDSDGIRFLIDNHHKLTNAERYKEHELVTSEDEDGRFVKVFMVVGASK